jgi:hypothetical protein
VAEIRVERKRRSLLPLLLGILGLLLIVWWFLNRGAGAGATGASDTALVSSGIAAPPATSDSAAGTVGDTAGAAPAAAAAPSGPVADFVAFVSATSATRSEDEQHAYTAGGLRRLATALEGMNPAGAARAQVDLMRQKADSLGITAEGDDRHADMTRAAFLAAAEAMRALPNAAGASAPLASVTRAAEAVRPDRHMLDQKDQIQAFFDAARDALRALGGTGAA